MKHPLLFPMVFYVIYILFLATYNFRTRVSAVRKKTVNMKAFAHYSSGDIPERLIVVGRHFDNQFQIPILFLVGGVAHLAVNSVTELTIALAWLFVASRLAHSYIHLGSNHIRKRAITYAVGLFLVVGFWLELLWA